MTMQALPGLSWLPLFDTTLINSGSANLVIDAAGEKVAYVQQIVKAGTIDAVLIRVGAVTSSQTLRVSLQTVDGNGDPTGTLFGGSAAGTRAAPAANTSYLVTLGTGATVATGDVVAVVIEFDSTAGNLQIVQFGAGTRGQFPYTSHFTASWAKQAGVGLPICALRYSDGTYYDHGTVIGPATFTAYHVNDTPDERAAKFKIPFKARCCGVYVRMNVPAGGDFDAVLYDSDGTTVLASRSVDGDHGLTSDRSRFIRFNTGVVLTADTFYRLSIKPTTTTTVSVGQWDALSADLLDAMGGGQNHHLSTRTNAGAWTDTTTAKPVLAPAFDQFDDGVSAGGRGGGLRVVGGGAQLASVM